MKGWPKARLDSLAEFRNGLNYSQANFGRGLRVIGVSDFQDFIVPKYSELAEINPDGVVLSENYLKSGDIVFVRSNGNRNLIGRCLLIENPPGQVSHSGFTIRLRFTATDVLPRFYAYFFRTSYLRNILSTQRGGSNINNLNQEILSGLVVPKPGFSEQQRIASVLSTLDAKIELNNRINAELEAMAKTLYDYWFVQFDFPDSKGNPYKSSGGKLVYNAELKREIPAGWEVGSLLDIADYTNGLACQKFRPNGGDSLRVIKIREMHEGFSRDSELVRAAIPNKLIIEDGDVLFSWSASLEVMIWTGGKGALNQHIFKVTSVKYPRSFYYFQLTNYLAHFKMMAERRKTTMGHITQDHLAQSRVILPPKEVTLELEKKLAPIFEMKIRNEAQDRSLASLRDWLLPMLMNGQVTVG